MLPPNPSCPFFHAGQTRTTEGKLAAGAKVSAPAHRVWARRNPRPQFRAAALPGQWVEPGHGGHHSLEHGLSRTRHARLACSRPGSGRLAAAAPLAARLGAHQPDRRLYLAPEPRTCAGEVSGGCDRLTDP